MICAYTKFEYTSRRNDRRWRFLPFTAHSKFLSEKRDVSLIIFSPFFYFFIRFLHKKNDAAADDDGDDAPEGGEQNKESEKCIKRIIIFLAKSRSLVQTPPPHTRTNQSIKPEPVWQLRSYRIHTYIYMCAPGHIKIFLKARLAEMNIFGPDEFTEFMDVSPFFGAPSDLYRIILCMCICIRTRRL